MARSKTPWVVAAVVVLAIGGHREPRPGINWVRAVRRS